MAKSLWPPMGRPSAARPNPRSYRARLQLCEFESRVVPASLAWTGNGTTANWSDVGNWNSSGPNAVPGNGDDVAFPAGALRLVNRDDLPNLTLNSLTIEGAGYTLNAASGVTMGVTSGIVVTNLTGTNLISIPLSYTTFGPPTSIVSVPLTVTNAGTTLNLTGNLSIAGPVALTVGGLGTANILGLVSGSGGVVQSGGTLTLAAAGNTFSGGTTLTGGNLRIRAGGAVGTGTLDLQGGQLSATGPGVTVTDPVMINGNVEFGGSLPLTFAQGAVTLTGDRTLTVDNTTAFTGPTGIRDGGLGFSLTKAGPGTLVLGASNSYGGGTVQVSGALVLGDNSALGTGPITVRGGVIADDGNAHTLANDLFLGGDFTFGGAGRLTFNGRTTLTADVLVTTPSLTGADVLNGPIGEDGTPRRLAKAGPGALTLGGLNTFSGGTVLEAGALGVENTAAFGTGVLVLDGGALTSDLVTVTLANPLRLGGQVRFATTGAGTTFTLTGPVTLTADTTLDVRTATTLGGPVDQDVPGRALTKAGLAALTLAGNNTYSGLTKVVAGTLIVNGAQPDSDVLVGRHGTLAGAGTVGEVTVAGGTLAPGTPDGTLQGSLTVTLSPLSTYVARLDGSGAGAFGQLTAQQGITLAGKLLPMVGPSSTMAAGTTVTIIQCAAGITGTFAGLPNNAVFNGGGGKFKIVYTGTAVTLTRMPVATTIKLATSRTPAPRGQTVTFTATVFGEPGGGTPTGTVTFKDGTKVLGVVTLSNGVASFSTSALSVGTHTISAVYSPDTTNFKTTLPAILKEVII